MEKKNVFISHYSKDYKKRDSLQKLLEASSLLQPKVIPKELDTDNDLGDKVIRGLKNSVFFVPIISSLSKNTQWLNQEIGYARALQDEGKIIIYALIADEIKKDLGGFIHVHREGVIFKRYNFTEKANELVTTLEKKINETNVKSNEPVKFQIRKDTIFVNNDGNNHLIMENNYILRNITNEDIVITDISLVLTNPNLNIRNYNKEIIDFKNLNYRENDQRKEIKYNPIILNSKETKNIKMQFISTGYIEDVVSLRNQFNASAKDIEDIELTLRIEGQDYKYKVTFL